MKKLKLSGEQKNKMLRVVREVIKSELSGNREFYNTKLDDEIFNERYGLFVTLKIDGNLRGCIGYVEGIKALKEAVPDMARQAAFHDPRFYPLKQEEFDKISVEISVLYPLEQVFDINEIEVGRDGLVMERGFYKGLLLPQVATEYHWDRERFLNETCRKAGMESYCWENKAKIFRFEAEVFGDGETV